MAKKNRVRMHCPVCRRATDHEVSTFEGQENVVCLVCKAYPGNKEDLKAMDRVKQEGEITMYSSPHYG